MEVVILEELMVKQLYKDKSSLLLYSVSMQANVVTAVEAITDKWTHFTPRDVMVPIDREAMEFPVFIMQHLPRGGQCKIIWQISVFFEATQLKGYTGTPSKWVFDRWDSCQAIMNNQRFVGTHLFKSTASKKPEDILHSIHCVLPKAAMTTVAMMTLLPRWASGTVEQGGNKDAPARAIAGSIFKGFVKHAHKEPFLLLLDCDPGCQWFFPRPQPGCPFILRLQVSDTGMVKLQPLKDAFDEQCKGDTEVPECVETWWHLIITHFSPAMGRTLHVSAFKICLEWHCSLMQIPECQATTSFDVVQQA